MERQVPHLRLARVASFLIALWLLSAAAQLALSGDTEEPDQNAPDATLGVEERLRNLERKSSQLADENRRLTLQLEGLPGASGKPSPEIGMPAADPASDASPYRAGYDKGFYISPRDPEQFPFEFKFNNQDQLRYAGFARDVRTWTDSAGIVSPVSDRSAFELNRGRAIFSGFAFSPRLTYNLTFDYTTVSASQINFWNYWLGYKFSRGLSLFIGQAQVPGTREWLTPFVYTQGPDYSLATTFFRPSLSQGIWANGEPVDGLFYRIMLCNGFNTLGSDPSEIDSRMTLSGTIWAEPLGDFGRGFSDFEWHEEPAVRFGTSFTYSPIQGQQGNPNQPENADIRLTNGTLITEPGALAPGVTLNVYHVALWAIDFAAKYRGVSVNGELYFRDLFNLIGNGPIPRSSIFDYGGVAQAGYFVLPQKLEFYGRTSQITGPFGYGSEYAGGFNCFCLEGKQNLRFTFDVAWVNHSPADQARTDYRVGDTGLLVRSQVQFFF
jgi:hypothetical protein